MRDPLRTLVAACGAALAWVAAVPAGAQDELFIGAESEAAVEAAGTDSPGTDGPSADSPGAEEIALLTARGVLEPADEALISAELAARISVLDLDAGDRFAVGDVLVAFDCSQYEAQLTQARAALQGAQAKLANMAALQRLNSVGQLDVQLAAAESAEASAAVAEAELAISRCTVTAPYDGRVVERMANVHEVAEPGTELLSIVSDGPLHLTLLVPSDWLRWLAEGEPLSFEVDETGDVLEGAVTTIGARVDPVSQRVVVRAVFPEAPARLLPGMSGAAVFRRAVD